jgi:tetratricopeptide (TPR) repeat protein
MRFRQAFLPILVIISLGALAVLPTLLAGWRDLVQARAASNALAAARQYEQAAGRLPWRADLLEEAASQALVGGDPGEAARIFEAAGERGALSADGLVSYGDALWVQGQNDKALEEWQKAETAGLRSAPLERRLAGAYLLQKDYTAAREALSRAVALDPEDARSELGLAMLLAASAPVQSLEHFSRATQLEPELGARIRPLREGIGRALRNDSPAGQLTEAGRALSAFGELELAVEALEAALALDPQAAGTWSLLGQVRESLGEDGLPEMEQALALAPRDPQVQVMQGLFWLRRGDDEKGLAHFARAAALDPQNPVFQAAKADALARTGDLKGAYETYQKAILLDEDNADYWRLLADFCVDYSYDIAGVGLSAALRAQAIAPEEYATLISMGRVALAQGQVDTAGPFFQRALEDNPTDPTAPLYLAMVSIERGDGAQARLYIDYVLKVDPAGPFGQQALLLLERYFGGS